MLLGEEVSCEREYKPIELFSNSAEHVIQSNLTDFLKFVGIVLATHVLISLEGLCVNFINICNGISKMLGILSIDFKTYF